MGSEIVLKLKLLFIPCQENQYRPKFLDSQFLFYYAIFILVLKLIIVPFFILFPKSIFFATITKNDLIELTNQKRENLGIQSLKENPKLNEAAYLKAKDILEKDYFSHQSPQGVSPWFWFKKAGYNYQSAGENLAIGFLDSGEVIRAWLDSPSHKRNLLEKNYEEMGIAVMRGEFEGNDTTVVVQLFGTPKTVVQAKEEPTKEEPKEITQPKEEVISSTPTPIGEVLAEKKEEEAVAKETLSFNFLRFVSLKYSDLLQKIIYSSLIFVITALMINIFVRVDIQYDDLILKTVVFILLLTFFIHLDKEFVIQLIPHNLNI